MIMYPNSSLGVFASLPRELRDQIWHCLSVQRCSNIFQTSHQIYTEASRTFYTNQILRLHIGPKYQRKSWLIIKSNLGAEWPLQSLDHAVQQGFNKLPFEKLKRLQINIEAPDSTDPGQLICLYQKCRDLVALLECAQQGLPDLEINLLDSALVKWSEEGKPKRSVSIDPKRHYPPLRRSFEYHPEGLSSDEFEDEQHRTQRFNRYARDPKPTYSLYDDDEESQNSDDDEEIILYTFSRLRNARSASISGPGQPDGHLRHNIALIIEQKHPFGTYLDSDDIWDDAQCQKTTDETYIQLDLDLDLLPGPTANMMRLDRFSSWYKNNTSGESKYAEEYERIIRTWTHFRVSFRRVWSLFRRFADMRSLDCPYSETLDREAWYDKWPEGIPPFDGREYSATFNHRRFKSYYSREYEDGFEEKLMDWFSDEDGSRAQRFSCQHKAKCYKCFFESLEKNVSLAELPHCRHDTDLSNDVWQTLSDFDRRTLEIYRMRIKR